MSFNQKLEKLWNEGKFVCVGLDPDFSKIPENFKSSSKNISDVIFNFNQSIVDETFDLVCSFKPQIAYFEEHGLEGWKALEKTIIYIKENHPNIPIILDAKRGDIGSTNLAYAKAYFDFLGVDALTVHPYLGKEALAPLLDYKDKAIFVLVKTSNEGAGEFQDLKIDEKPLYQVVAQNIANDWNQNGNCAVVVGATYPKELFEVRKIIGDMLILIPGIGTQGGDLKAAIEAGKNSKGQGMIINSSRGIIFADSPREACKKLSDEIQSYLK